MSESLPPYLQFNHMQQALQQAELAALMSEVPIGAVIIDADGNIIAKSHNRKITDYDPTAHAEIIAIRKACKLKKSDRLLDCDMYVTLEPCAMCAAAISHAKVKRLYFAAEDQKAGAIENGIRFFEQSYCNHRPEIYSGIAQRQAKELLLNFFRQKRQKNDS